MNRKEFDDLLLKHLEQAADDVTANPSIAVKPHGVEPVDVWGRAVRLALDRIEDENPLLVRELALIELTACADFLTALGLQNNQRNNDDWPGLVH